MRAIIFLITWCIPIFCIAQDLNELDKKNGFRGIELGSKIHKYECMQTMTPEYATKNNLSPEWDYYNTLCNHKLIIGQTIAHLLFKTADNKISEIAIISKADRNIIKSLSDLYGEPTYFTPNLDLYYWRSEKIELRVFFEINKMTINYKSYAWSLKRDEIKAEKESKKAKKQFIP
ncbi:hypothetical protein SAMN04487906_2971 [Zhouia amylolytica]|uniref:Uncharacterized protein n=2 Tax=Zhouia amylolytica TaxID=376730 RepID=W2UM08_9FLAO|nr:hypothetical protein [Zhouia amylolytica]ETN94347.1 hypothetical protein P278_22890 [Zhouia amylolytica AD3]SFT11183.1 hypothetical protein SAMN04487906_2971 [Zhouia amylolytica]